MRQLQYGLTLFTLCVLLAHTAQAQHMNATDAPCRQPASNAETGECFFNAAKDADKKLNRTYDKIIQILHGQDQASLKEAQRLWIKFREANCSAERGLYGRGTGGPVNYSACMEAEARQRTDELVKGYGWILEKNGVHP